MKTYRCIEARTIHAEQVNSGILDSKGRDQGYSGVVRHLVYEALPEGDPYGWSVDPSKPYEASVQKLKGGKVFGASQPHSKFATKEEALEFVRLTIAKRLISLTKKGGA
jgi:hypothetical protein